MEYIKKIRPTLLTVTCVSINNAKIAYVTCPNFYYKTIDVALLFYRIYGVLFSKHCLYEEGNTDNGNPVSSTLLNA